MAAAAAILQDMGKHRLLQRLLEEYDPFDQQNLQPDQRYTSEAAPSHGCTHFFSSTCMSMSALASGLSESNRVDPKLVLHGIHGLVLTLPVCMTCAKRLSVSVWVYRCHLGDALRTLLRHGLCRLCRLHQQAHTNLINAGISRCSCSDSPICQRASVRVRACLRAHVYVCVCVCTCAHACVHMTV